MKPPHEHFMTSITINKFNLLVESHHHLSEVFHDHRCVSKDDTSEEGRNRLEVFRTYFQRINEYWKERQPGQWNVYNKRMIYFYKLMNEEDPPQAISSIITHRARA